MNERSPIPVGAVTLGPGFLGGWRRLAGLQEAFRLEAAAGDAPPFGALAALARRLEPGEVLAGFIGYEAAGPDALPASPGLGGVRLPAVWAGRFARADAVPPPGRPDTVAAAPPPDETGGEGRATYEAKVEAVRRAILAGDLFQANLSRRLWARWAAAPGAAALFATLTGGTDAPYAALIDLPEGAVLSASPELFLRVDGDRVTAEPIKGTRPRGATAKADAALAAALSASAKDRAENVMIADLLRNDLSLVARDGTVAAPEVCALRSLPRVHHLYSRIEAGLRDGLGPFDALAACFPCGSITGAPKPAAMRLIAALEGEGRGPYCGTVFAVPHRGPAVFSVAIRTGVLTRSGRAARLDVRAGGGVTVLSDPADEFDETEDKAYPFRLMTGRLTNGRLTTDRLTTGPLTSRPLTTGPLTAGRPTTGGAR